MPGKYEHIGSHWRTLGAEDLGKFTLDAMVDIVAARADDLFAARLVPHLHNPTPGPGYRPPQITALRAAAVRMRAIVYDTTTGLDYFDRDYSIGILAPDAEGVLTVERNFAYLTDARTELYHIHTKHPDLSVGRLYRDRQKAHDFTPSVAVANVLHILGVIAELHSVNDYENAEPWRRAHYKFATPALQDAWR